MASKYKSTGCARFLIALIVLIPLAYFGAKMIRGGEGIPQVDHFIENLFSSDDKVGDDTKVLDEGTEEMEELRRENAELRRQIKELESENRQLRQSDGGIQGD